MSAQLTPMTTLFHSLKKQNVPEDLVQLFRPIIHKHRSLLDRYATECLENEMGLSIKFLRMDRWLNMFRQQLEHYFFIFFQMNYMPLNVYSNYIDYERNPNQHNNQPGGFWKLFPPLKSLFELQIQMGEHAPNMHRALNRAFPELSKALKLFWKLYLEPVIRYPIVKSCFYLQNQPPVNVVRQITKKSNNQPVLCAVCHQEVISSVSSKLPFLIFECCQWTAHEHCMSEKPLRISYENEMSSVVIPKCPSCHYTPIRMFSMDR